MGAKPSSEAVMLVVQDPNIRVRRSLHVRLQDVISFLVDSKQQFFDSEIRKRKLDSGNGEALLSLASVAGDLA